MKTKNLAIALLAVVSLTGCTRGLSGLYGEVSTGAYSVDGTQQNSFGYELGASAGLYLEGDYVGGGFGWGGDVLWTEYEGRGPPSEVEHNAMSGNILLGLALVPIGAKTQVWVQSSFSLNPGNSVEVDVVDPGLDDPQLGGNTYSTYLGATLKVYISEIVVWFGTGPAYMWTHGMNDLGGSASAWGAQFRIGLAGAPDFSRSGGGLMALFQSGYDAESGARSLDEDMRQHNRNMEQRQQMQCVDDPNCRLVPAD